MLNLREISQAFGRAVESRDAASRDVTARCQPFFIGCAGIEAALTSRLKDEPSVPIPILANYLASELFFLLKWWLDYGMTYSPERMDQIYHDLITPTLRSQLKYFEMGTAPRQTADPSNYVRLRR